jgi:hypothetical protein
VQLAVKRVPFLGAGPLVKKASGPTSKRDLKGPRTTRFGQVFDRITNRWQSPRAKGTHDLWVQWVPFG